MPADLLPYSPTKPAPIPPLLLTPREAAKALAICEKTLWTLTHRGDLRCLRIGRAVRYRIEDLRTWIDAQAQGVML